MDMAPVKKNLFSTVSRNVGSSKSVISLSLQKLAGYMDGLKRHQHEYFLQKTLICSKSDASKQKPDLFYLSLPPNNGFMTFSKGNFI